MPDKFKHAILIVDDEEGILKALSRLFAGLEVDIMTVSGGEEALNVLENERISLIISDQRMPGMTGVELLRRSREIFPDTIRILLTGYADIDATIDAINDGAVKYYMNKPWDDDYLISRVKESLDLYEAVTENRKLNELTRQQNEKLREFNENLEEKVAEQTKEIKKQHDELSKSFMETIKAFSTIVETRFKEVGSHSQRVASLAKKLLEGLSLNKKECQDVVVAAMLHDIGKISLPDKIINKSAENLTRSDIEKMQKHPILGQSCLVAINGFEEIAMIVRHHHENYDGTGYPDGLKEKRIPLGSRMIRIIDSFDRYAFLEAYPTFKTLNMAAAHLVQYSGAKFDPDLVKRFIELDMSRHLKYRTSVNVDVVHPSALEVEMVIAEDVYTDTRLFLVPKGAKLSAGMINRIRKIDAFDAIRTGIKVYKKVEREEDKYAPV